MRPAHVVRVADGEDRIQGGHGILENHGHALAAHGLRRGDRLLPGDRRLGHHRLRIDGSDALAHRDLVVHHQDLKIPIRLGQGRGHGPAHQGRPVVRGNYDAHQRLPRHGEKLSKFQEYSSRKIDDGFSFIVIGTKQYFCDKFIF